MSSPSAEITREPGLAIAEKRKSRITEAEMERRREAVRQADADNRLEGIYRDPDSDAIFEAFIRGEIEVTDMVPLLKARLGLP
jgi:hypothetical protein